MVEHHEFVIKPTFNEGLARKIPPPHCRFKNTNLMFYVILLVELRSEMDESESKATKVLRKVSNLILS